MWRLMQCAVIFVTITIIRSLNIDDVCTTTTGHIGFCRRISDCSSAIRDIRLGKFPVTCSFEKNTVIVCCPYEQDGNKTNPTTIGPPSISSNTEKQSMSSKKCKEYGELVFSNETSPILLPGVNMITVDTCGIGKEISTLSVARPREFPHLALIGYKYSRGKIWKCGGALLNERYVLTSARCTSSETYGSAKYVRLGDLDLFDKRDIAEPQDIDVSEIINHPQYNQLTLHNDIGLLKLATPAILNSFVRPVCLPSSDVFDFGKVLASGWGTLTPSGNVEPILKRVSMDLVNNNECPREHRNDSKFCARVPYYRDVECVADRGGPVQIYHQDVYCSYIVVGVTSSWEACGGGGGGVETKPAVFTKVSKYVDWIEDHIW